MRCTNCNPRRRRSPRSASAPASSPPKANGTTGMRSPTPRCTGRSDWVAIVSSGRTPPSPPPEGRPQQGFAMIDLPTDSAPAHSAATTSPQVRTLLLTDLCDSTLLVERLGDAPAAELFRAHDRLVLELQQRWRGRLIDRSDGLLLL